MDANISFCEHHETGITHDIAIKHRISPPQSCLICAPASSRKSDQEAAATELLLGAAGAPAAWNERRILLSDGTKKGCENLLVDLREALNTSAEACNAIFVPGFSDPNAGIQYQSRQRLVQWTQSEGISTTTATGQMVLHPNTYKFQGRYLAQNEVGELLMAPNAQALQKRFAFACHEEAFEADIAQGLARDTHSQATLQELHSWLVTNVLPHKVTLILDGYALAFYDAVAEGVQSFLNSPTGLACDANFKVKVRFFRSDLLRQTMIVMRSAQFFAGEQQIVDATGQPTLRTAAKVDEIVLGLRRLFRQWRLHFAMLRVAGARSPQAGLPRSGPAAGSAAVGLLPEELVQKTVLAETEPGASLTARTLRKKFKNLRPVRRVAAQYNMTIGQLMLSACQALHTKGLLRCGESAAGSTSQPLFQKVPLAEHGETATACRAYLSVSVTAFPA